jgi:hypothetical protein
MVGRVVGTNGTSSAAVTSCKICGRQYTARRDFYRNRNITSFLGILVLNFLHVKKNYENLNFMAFRKGGGDFFWINTVPP